MEEYAKNLKVKRKYEAIEYVFNKVTSKDQNKINLLSQKISDRLKILKLKNKIDPKDLDISDAYIDQY